ncbi:hypothetical protein M0R45_017861 [Rubus argutus]|uniref:non-specific serine/threonine protein kinase n=1 Tax=Rubus argutus TaxID=59490 RepID=A0AAW1XYV0_RUBAR
MAFKLLYALSFLLLLLPIPTIAQTYPNISFGSSLPAQEDSPPWASPSGEFAFGFRKLSNDGFILAIWFDKIPEKTIVWSANGNNLAPKGSTVELNTFGQLVLNYASGEQTLISHDQSKDTGVAYAAMLDTGNFVLADRDSNNLFQLTLESNGSVVLYTTNFPLDSTNFPYKRIEPITSNLVDADSAFQLIFNQSGSIYVTDSKGNIRTIVSDRTVSVQDFYHRATFDYDGVFRHYTYPKNNGSSVWSTLLFIPKNICWELTEETGGGACGFNIICKQDPKGPTTCECPKNYMFIDPNDERKGCKQNFLPQSCDEASPETDLFGFQAMLNTDWPNGDYEHFQPVTEEWCKQTCLSDCFCAIAIYDGSRSDCWKKGIPLSNGRMDLGVGWTSLVKIRLGNSTRRPLSIPDAKTKRSSNLTLIGSVLMLIVTHMVVVIISCLVVSHIYSRKAKVSDLYPVINLKCFTYLELKLATSGFKEVLGRGAFATVYKGVLASDKGKLVAVKRLDTVVRENDWEFKAEVSAIGGTNHRNLVKLQGFCNEGQHRILVYEFMSNGSLASFLFGESRPSWYQRRDIALGTARGLSYLHEECSSQIIHCDIKPQNILLDDSFTARIADFGVAKLLKTDQTRTTTRFRGTKGYVAPEWYKSLPVTVKADVYSYGVLLLEIIFCRKNFEADAEDEDQMILADWAYNCYKQQKLHLILQNDDDAIDDIKMVEKYVMIAFWCIQEDPSMRPTMKIVTQMLEGILEVSVPQNPSSLYAI